jgi:hypothetical protein
MPFPKKLEAVRSQTGGAISGYPV